MKKVNWKIAGGILAAIVIVAALAYYKPWLSEEEKAKLEAEKKAADAKAKAEADAKKASTPAKLVNTPVGRAYQN